MDRHRIDRIAKLLAAGGTRRTFLSAFAGAVTGAVLTARVTPAPVLADPGPAPVGAACSDSSTPYGGGQCVDECADGAGMDAGGCTVCAQLTVDTALCVGMPGYPCSGQADCHGVLGHFCDDVSGLCVAATGGICTSDAWCAIGSCVDGVGTGCVATINDGCTCQCTQLLGACEAPSDCCEGLTCSGGVCLIVDGGRCPNPDSCETGICADPASPSDQCFLDASAEWLAATPECYCGVQCSGLFGACPNGDMDCCAGLSCSGGTCLITDGERCPSPETCASGTCADADAPWEQCYLDPAGDWGAAAQQCYCGVSAGATITVHYRCCPEGAVNVYEECHHMPISDLEVALSSGEWGYTDLDGNYVFSVTSEGPWELTDALGAEPIGVYCSMEDAVGTDVFINDGMTITLPGPDTSVICDVYYVGVCAIDDGKKDGGGGGKGKGKGKGNGKGGVKLPETGVAEDVTLGAAIVGVAAVAVGANILGRKIGQTSRNE